MFVASICVTTFPWNRKQLAVRKDGISVATRIFHDTTFETVDSFVTVAGVSNITRAFRGLRDSDKSDESEEAENPLRHFGSVLSWAVWDSV